MVICCVSNKHAFDFRNQGTCSDLLIEEKAAFLPLPKQPFEPVAITECGVNSESLVDTNDYSVPIRYAHCKLIVVATVRKPGLCMRIGFGLAIDVRETESGLFSNLADAMALLAMNHSGCCQQMEPYDIINRLNAYAGSD